MHINNIIIIIIGSPCEHNGICVNTPGSFACNCTQGFTGPRCETNINECESHPCQNEGSCLDDPGSFRCVCMPGNSYCSTNFKLLKKLLFDIIINFKIVFNSTEIIK